MGDIHFFRNKSGLYTLQEYNRVVLFNATLDEVIEKIREMEMESKFK